MPARPQLPKAAELHVLIGPKSAAFFPERNPVHAANNAIL
jgi:hypothetical protein